MIDTARVDAREITQKERNWSAQAHLDDRVVRYLLIKDLTRNNLYPYLPHAIDAVFDADDSYLFRARDVDLLIHDAYNKNWLELEVKVDGYEIVTNYRTQKKEKFIAVETVSNDAKGTPGWLYTSEANYFLYYFKAYDRYIILDADWLRQYVDDNKNTLVQFKTRTFAGDNKTIIYHSLGYLVPIFELNLRWIAPARGFTFAKAQQDMVRQGLLPREDPNLLF